VRRSREPTAGWSSGWSSGSGLVLIAVLLVALTMRAPILAVAPALSDVKATLHIGAGTAGLFTTIPVLCFGLGTPVALGLARRSGLDRSVLIGLIATAAGVLLRSAGGLAAALLGTLVIGLAITIGNVLVPVIIGRDFPGRISLVTASYTSALNVGSVLATTLSAPLADAFGWRPSLACWAFFAVLAAGVWRLASRRRSSPPPTDLEPLPSPIPTREQSELRERPQPEPAANQTPLWRRPLVVGMTVVFAGQSFSYYGISAWLPTLLSDDLGLSSGSAGASSSIFQLVALVGAFAVPAMIAGRLSPRFVLLTVCTAWIILPLGLAFAPSWWAVWCSFGGFAQGGGFTVIVSVIVARATDMRDSRRMSGAVQGVGYTLGATGPFAVGSVHSLAGDWLTPMLMVAGAVVMMAIAGSIGVGSPRPAVRAG
jgi:CP family cyanate transporter-like MFS transporter